MKSSVKKLPPSYFHSMGAKNAKTVRPINTRIKTPSLVAFFALIFTVGAVISAKTVVNEAFNTASFFVRSALPAMLPFTVASAVLIKSGFGSICQKSVGAAFPKLFGINGSLSAPFILGAIAGFPIGAKSIAELYACGECTEEEAEKALSLCSNPGFGFTVAGVGGVMWGDRIFGLTAWLSCLLSSVAIGMITKDRKHTDRTVIRCTDHKTLPQAEPYSVSKTVSDSVKEASVSLLAVFAFVVFFKTVSTVILGAISLLPFAKDNRILSAVTSAFFEFSSGVSAISELKYTIPLPHFFKTNEALIPQLLTVAALAWSGMSVHLQTTGFTVPYGISMKKYYRRKIASALLAPLCFLLLNNLFST